MLFVFPVAISRYTPVRSVRSWRVNRLSHIPYRISKGFSGFVALGDCPAIMHGSWEIGRAKIHQMQYR